MYALMSDSPYDGAYPVAYFDREEDANEALKVIYEHDEITHPGLPREDWDWGYFVKLIETQTLEEFKALYNVEETKELYKEIFSEKTTLGGDDCYTGRGLWRGDSSPDALIDSGINVLTHS